jgi:hypothetical protein
MYRRVFREAAGREIGEGYMRGQAANVAGIVQLVIHPPGESPSEPSDGDIWLGARYRDQRFLSCVRPEYLPKLIDEWPRFAKAAAETEEGKRVKFDPDPRGNARSFIFSIIVGNQWQNDMQLGAVTAAAIGWLARTSSMGATFGDVHKVAHYEITDLEGITAPGRNKSNWRLIMTRDMASFAIPDLPVPKWGEPDPP